MQIPTLSIILPVYNGEAFLGQAIDSVLNSTLKSWELILVNDGSTDSTGDLCQAYCLKDKRIHSISQDNRGLSGARNAGFSHAVGTWIAYLDADDFVEPDYYERLVTEAEESGAEFLVTGFTREFWRNGRSLAKRDSLGRNCAGDNSTGQDTMGQDSIGQNSVRQNSPKQNSTRKSSAGQNSLERNHVVRTAWPRRYLKTPEEIRNACGELWFYHVYIHVWNKIYRRDYLNEHGILFDESLRYGEDVPYNLRILSEANTILFVDHVGYHYICRIDSSVADQTRKLRSNRPDTSSRNLAGNQTNSSTGTQGSTLDRTLINESLHNRSDQRIPSQQAGISGQLTVNWREELPDYNGRIFREIAALEKRRWQVDRPVVAAGMYLRSCCLTIEKMAAAQLPKEKQREVIKELLQKKETVFSRNICRKRLRQKGVRQGNLEQENGNQKSLGQKDFGQENLNQKKPNRKAYSRKLYSQKPLIPFEFRVYSWLFSIKNPTWIMAAVALRCRLKRALGR